MSTTRNKYFLGFMSYCSHDPAAALVEITSDNGKLSCNFAHFEEGMLSRKKKSYHFPSRSIAACLNFYDIDMSDITQVTTDFMDYESFIDTSLNYRHLVGDFIRSNINFEPEQIAPPVDHHYAHAMAAWVGSGFSDCAILAIDGLGSNQSTHSIFVTEDSKLKKLFSQTSPGIGSLYSLVTELIGFKAGEEGKTMGLAPYGKALSSNETYPEINFYGVYRRFSVDFSTLISRAPDSSLITDFGLSNFEPKDLYNDFRAKLAFNIQSELERTILHLATEIRRTTGKNSICLTGGVALNCVANEILANSGIFDSVYVFPDSADSGLSVGLAFSGVRSQVTDSQWNEVLANFTYPKFAPSRSVPRNTSKFIEELPWKQLDLDYVADELLNNAVVGVFYKAFEYGPRALGHRSFLANATSPLMKSILNSKIKHREAYRPFAPICLKEDFSKFFASSHHNHEFMSYAVKVNNEAIDLIPSIVHADGTARVQIATEDCGIAYQLLLKLKQKYGYGVLINTSMNDNDEPIVYDILDAVSCFLRTNCDVLIDNKRMLLRQDIGDNIHELQKEIEAEAKVTHEYRFKDSIRKILKKECGSLTIFLREKLDISNYNTKYRTNLKLRDLFLRVKFGNKLKFNRLLVSNREYTHLQNLLLNYYFLLSDFAEDLLIIEDNPSSIEIIRPGDIIISYNLSNIIRDYKSLGLIVTDNFENFYASKDCIISEANRNHKNLDLVVGELQESYENQKSLDIESAFAWLNEFRN